MQKIPYIVSQRWIRFTTLLASRIIKDAIVPLESKDRANVLGIDDSMFERNRSKKVELLAKAYDHTNHRYRFGFRMFTLGWSDGSTFLLANSVPLSSENRKNRVNGPQRLINERLDINEECFPCKKGHRQCLNF